MAAERPPSTPFAAISAVSRGWPARAGYDDEERRRPVLTCLRFAVVSQDEAYAELAADIQAFGLRQPIVMFDGKILDGRNRYRACLDAGVPYHTEAYDGDDPLGFVLSADLHRRHLDESQRSMVGARLTKMEKGRPKENASIEAVSPGVRGGAA